MSPTELADANLIESIRSSARKQTPCEVCERDGLLLIAGATRAPIGIINGAIRVDPGLAAPRALQMAMTFFAERGRNFTFLTRSHTDADLELLFAPQGFFRDSDAPCMWVETALRAPALPEGVRIEYLTAPRHVADVVKVSEQAYRELGLPEKHTRAAFSRLEGVLEERTAGVIAYRDDEPVSTALMYMSGSAPQLCGGVYWVGTIPSARGRGLAEICTALATNAGFERGAKIVTLQASQFGEPIYRRMGYREYGRTRSYRQVSQPG